MKLTNSNIDYSAASDADRMEYTPRHHDHRGKRFSWQPVLAGIVAALAVQMVLGFFGIAMGLGLVSLSDPDAAPTATTVGLGASMYAAVSIVSAMFYGGFIAARMSKNSCCHEGILHGIITWAGTVIVVGCLLSSAVGGALGGAGKLVGGAGVIAAKNKPMHGPQIDAMKQETHDLMYGTAIPANMSADQAQADIAAQEGVMALGGRDTDAAKQHLSADLQSQGVSKPDADARVDALQQKQMAAKQKAKEDADKAAHAAAKAAIAFGVVLLLGAFTAALGGVVGALHVAEDRKRHLTMEKEIR